MTVSLVGAGPGDPGLLTVRGAELLRAADVVVYDRLVHPSLVDLAPARAERVYVGKAPRRAEMAQADINSLLVERGRAGHAVVRLKGGDPFVFGRGGEEAEALAAAGVPFEVVPGITSAIGAPAYAGIPVTHRGLSTHVTVVTGHEDPAKGAGDVDWGALARAGGTLVILMGAGRIGDIAARLVAGGRSPDTPVAAVRNGTRADQRTVRATLATVVEAGVQAPAAIVVGDVAGLDLSWFESRPLFGRSVVVTRAREQASELRRRLEALGAEVVELPAIALEPVDFELPPLDRHAWLVFTSANGVHAFVDRGLREAGLDARALAGTKIAAIGPGTAAALADHGLRADLLPERFVAESLLEAFPPPAAPAEGVLLARAERARDVLPAGLTERGYEVDVLAVYRTVTAAPDPAVVERVRAGEVDALTFTSSSTVTNLCDLLGVTPAPQPLVVSIGPVTSKTAMERGLRVDVEATEHTIDGLVDALLHALTSGGTEPAPD
jgi:uroporphyrinogen III methyltransferase/synthase